jgi:hypothetical protein
MEPDFSFLDWYLVQGDVVMMLLDRNAPPTVRPSRSQAEVVDMLVNGPWDRRGMRHLADALTRFCNDPRFLGMSTREIGLCLFKDLDVGIFNGYLAGQVCLALLSPSVQFKDENGVNFGHTAGRGAFSARVCIRVGDYQWCVRELSIARMSA